MSWECSVCNQHTADGQKHECVYDEIEKLREENRELKEKVIELTEFIKNGESEAVNKLINKVAELESQLAHVSDLKMILHKANIGIGDRPAQLGEMLVSEKEKSLKLKKRIEALRSALESIHKDVAHKVTDRFVIKKEVSRQDFYDFQDAARNALKADDLHINASNPQAGGGNNGR